MEHCPTEDTQADFPSKPLQGEPSEKCSSGQWASNEAQAQSSEKCCVLRNNVGPIERSESKSMMQAQVGQQKRVELRVNGQMAGSMASEIQAVTMATVTTETQFA